MTRRILGTLLIALCGVASPGFAETIYVPIVATQVGDVSYETRVMISNFGATDGPLTTYFIPIETDGADRPDDAGQDAIILGYSTFTTLPHVWVS